MTKLKNLILMPAFILALALAVPGPVLCSASTVEAGGGADLESTDLVKTGLGAIDSLQGVIVALAEVSITLCIHSTWLDCSRLMSDVARM